MAKYRVQQQFFQWDEVIVEASSKERALEIAQDTWGDLEVEGVGHYVPTGTWVVVNDKTGEETVIE